MVPAVVFEDEHLLVVNKPASMNTHAPSPFANEGIYDWLRHREPRWAHLAILHRLDKETSGVLVFGKTPAANRSLAAQFEERKVQKTYVLVVDRAPEKTEFVVRSHIARQGDRYISRSDGNGVSAETRFCVAGRHRRGTLIEAQPVTGRTHQIRVHASDQGLPILGDTLYGGSRAERVFLHAQRLAFRHPVTNAVVTFEAPVSFDADPRQELRRAVIDPSETDAFRLLHGAADGLPGWYVDRFGPALLSTAEQPLSSERETVLRDLARCYGCESGYHKLWSRHVRGAARDHSPQLSFGTPSGAEAIARENGVAYSIRFQEGYSVGLFLDQRDNRRRLLSGYIAPDFSFEPRTDAGPMGGLTVLNTFAYTCGFSLCAALAGAQVTSLDLSRKYLEWGRRNFTLNAVDPAQHDFIFGDVFDWLKRLQKKQRVFDVVLLDPPTFSQSKQHGIFRAEKDYGELARLALGVLKPSGWVFASTNAADLPPEDFIETVAAAVRRSGRRILRQHFAPQPPDFPASREEPGYLKTVWFRTS